MIEENPIEIQVHPSVEQVAVDSKYLIQELLIIGVPFELSDITNLLTLAYAEQPLCFCEEDNLEETV